jgi:hypothetical protein
MASKVDFLVACNIKELEAALSAIVGKPKVVVISALTNPICDHVGTVTPQSVSNLQYSVRTLLNEAVPGILYPFCERMQSSKVMLSVVIFYYFGSAWTVLTT